MKQKQKRLNERKNTTFFLCGYRWEGKRIGDKSLLGFVELGIEIKRNIHPSFILPCKWKQSIREKKGGKKGR